MTTPSSAPNPATGGSKAFGILSLVFGIVSLLGFLFLPILFIFLAIAGVVVGFLSRRREPGARTLALAGIITSFIGIAVNIASMVIGAILVAQLMS